MSEGINCAELRGGVCTCHLLTDMRTDLCFLLRALLCFAVSTLISPEDSLPVLQTEEVRNFQYATNAQEADYLLFELFVDEQSPLPKPFVLTGSYGEKTSFADLEESELVDYSGWYGEKKYLYLQVDRKIAAGEPTFYLNVFANLSSSLSAVHYTLTVSSLQSPICPNACFHHGDCTLGLCHCASSYSDLACDVPVTSLSTDQSVVLSGDVALYFYVETGDMMGNDVEVRWSTGYPVIMTKEGLCAYKTPLPSSYEHRDLFLSNTTAGIVIVHGEDNSCLDSQFWSFRISVSVNEPAAVTIRLKKSDSPKPESVIIIVISIVGATVAVAWASFLVWKILTKIRRRNREIANSLPASLLRMQKLCPKKTFRSLPKAFSKQPCPICLDEFEEKSEVRVMPCNHVYHLKCIDQWFERSTMCCFCKMEVFKDGENPRDTQVATEQNETRLNESVMQTDLRVVPIE